MQIRAGGSQGAQGPREGERGKGKEGRWVAVGADVTPPDSTENNQTANSRPLGQRQRLGFCFNFFRNFLGSFLLDWAILGFLAKKKDDHELAMKLAI